MGIAVLFASLRLSNNSERLKVALAKGAPPSAIIINAMSESSGLAPGARAAARCTARGEPAFKGKAIGCVCVHWRVKKGGEGVCVEE